MDGEVPRRSATRNVTGWRSCLNQVANAVTDAARSSLLNPDYRRQNAARCQPLGMVEEIQALMPEIEASPKWREAIEQPVPHLTRGMQMRQARSAWRPPDIRIAGRGPWSAMPGLRTRGASSASAVSQALAPPR